MYRLSNLAFSEAPELQSLATYCVTEIIKGHLEPYFEKGYIEENDETLYTKVKFDKLLKIFPKKILREIEGEGVDPSIFISKKLSQFMIMLNSSKQETPDIFIEYMLTKLIKKQARLKTDYTPKEVLEKKPALKKLLIEYLNDCVVDLEEFESDKERKKYHDDCVSEYMLLTTDFRCLLGVDGPDERSIVFWDWDFAFFDNWGFGDVLEGMVHGVIPDYSLDYTKKIFTSVGESTPSVVKHSEHEKKKAKITGEGKEQFLAAASKALTRPGEILYFPVAEGLAFLTATDREDGFQMLKALFDSGSNIIDLRVYVEKDTLFMHIGDQLLHNFTFGLSDKELVRNTLLTQSGFDFVLLHRNESGVNVAQYQATFSARHVEVIDTFVNNTYTPDVNLKDKFGDYATHETEHEALLDFLRDLLNNNTVGPGPSAAVLEFIQKKYVLEDIDENNEAVVNEVLDYVLGRYIINVQALGFCVHDKEELMI